MIFGVTGETALLLPIGPRHEWPVFWCLCTQVIQIVVWGFPWSRRFFASQDLILSFESNVLSSPTRFGFCGKLLRLVCSPIGPVPLPIRGCLGLTSWPT